MERLSFNRSSSALNSPVTGAAAHMSLHLNQQCQRADAFPSPVFIRDTGDRLRETQTRLGKSPCPVGEGAIYGGVPAPSMVFSKSFPTRSAAALRGCNPTGETPFGPNLAVPALGVRAFREKAGESLASLTRPGRRVFALLQGLSIDFQSIPTT